MADVYAQRADLYRYGLTRGELANPARLCASVLAATNAFELDAHGLEADDPVMLRAESGGALPAPLVAGETYYAIRDSASVFRVAATPGGPPIDLTSNGSSVLVITPLPVDQVLEFYSRFVDPFLPAHLVPLKAPYPITVTGVVAELSAARLLRIATQSSESMKDLEVGAMAQLQRWAKGVPLRDARATGAANLAVSASAGRDPRGWGGGGTIP
jgi:hypothetical protein